MGDDKEVLVTIKTLMAGEDPSIEIYHVTLWRDPGVWTETFGSKEHLEAFMTGLRAGASYSHGAFYIKEVVESSC